MSALHVAYVTVGKADDVHEWSGLNAAIRGALLGQGCAVDDVDQLGASYPMRLRVRKKVMAQLGSTFALERTPHAAAQWSQAAAEKLARLRGLDAIVATSTLPLAKLQSDLPTALWADATFHALRTTYPEYAKYSRASIEGGEALEHAALNRASLLCYASQWAAQDAIDYYGVPARKVRVIEFGANAESPFRNGPEASQCALSRGWHTLKFAFIGVDWQRKGGPLAAEIVGCLNDNGVRSELAVVGCQPPAEVSALPFVRVLGFLSKKDPAGRARLHDVLRESHFLLMPTLAECFGLVFAEAAAFAVPSISRAVGGVTTAIQHGTTGVLLGADAGADAYCSVIRDLVEAPGRYHAMCAAAFQDFQRRLNWQVAGARFVAELQAALQRPVAVSS
jgi:glycosyltransferase involved in cell wall biosynthesis